MPCLQGTRVVTPALIGGSGRAPREPLVPSQQQGVRPPIPGSPIPQPEKNRRVCVEGRQAKALQAEASCGFNSRHIHLGYASRCGRRMHRRLHQGNIIITCSASGSTMGCSRPLIFPGESRDKLPRQGGRRRLCNLRLVASAFSLLLYTKPRGTNFRTSEFHRSSSPSGPLRAEPLESATPHSQWRE